MDLKELSAIGAMGAIAVEIVSLCGGFGSRGKTNDYSFIYKGQPAAVVRNDVRWGPDTFSVKVGDDCEFSRGKIITDDGKEINCGNGSWQDYSYSIRDSKEK